jgi:hypothetical protein
MTAILSPGFEFVGHYKLWAPELVPNHSNPRFDLFSGIVAE